MFISLTSILFATYISTVLAAPLDTRNFATNSLEARGPPAPKGATAAGAKTCTPKTAAKPSGKKRSLEFPRRSILDQVVELYRRNDEVFIGWHGTNANTAELWRSHGSIIKPAGNGGKSGLDAELGPGLYITDTLSTAGVAATMNGNNNRLAPKVCAIYAKNRGDWNKVPKAEIPETLRGNADQKETWRKKYLSEAAGIKGDGVRFGPLTSGHQLLIPESLNPTLEARCYDVDAQGNSAGATALGVSVDYSHPSTKVAWTIFPAKNDVAEAVSQEVGCITS